MYEIRHSLVVQSQKQNDCYLFPTLNKKELAHFFLKLISKASFKPNFRLIQVVVTYLIRTENYQDLMTQHWTPTTFTLLWIQSDLINWSRRNKPFSLYMADSKTKVTSSLLSDSLDRTIKWGNFLFTNKLIARPECIQIFLLAYPNWFGMCVYP